MARAAYPLALGWSSAWPACTAAADTAPPPVDPAMLARIRDAGDVERLALAALGSLTDEIGPQLSGRVLQ